MTITEFLLARIAEDEDLVTPASPREDRVGGNGIDWAEVGAIREVLMVSESRVRAECAAKRRIVGEHRTRAAAYTGMTVESYPCCDVCSAGGEYPGVYPCATLCALASVYADHPDFDPAWK